MRTETDSVSRASFLHECYNRYEMLWCARHGITLHEILYTYIDSPDKEASRSFAEWKETHPDWPDFAAFITDIFPDRKTMKMLLSGDEYKLYRHIRRKEKSASCTI